MHRKMHLKSIQSRLERTHVLNKRIINEGRLEAKERKIEFAVLQIVSMCWPNESLKSMCTPKSRTQSTDGIRTSLKL